MVKEFTIENCDFTSLENEWGTHQIDLHVDTTSTSIKVKLPMANKKIFVFIQNKINNDYPLFPKPLRRFYIVHRNKNYKIFDSEG